MLMAAGPRTTRKSEGKMNKTSGKIELDGRLGSHLLDLLHALRPESVGMNAQGLGDAGAELFRLDQHGDKVAQTVQHRCDPPYSSSSRMRGGRRAVPAPRCPIHRRWPAATCSALLAVRDGGLVQAQSCFDTYHQQVEHIGQAPGGFVLALLDARPSQKSGARKPMPKRHDIEEEGSDRRVLSSAPRHTASGDEHLSAVEEF